MSGMAGLASLGGMTEFMGKWERAKALDPEAFKPVHIPHYSDDQIWRQRLAMERVERELGDEKEPTEQ